MHILLRNKKRLKKRMTQKKMENLIQKIFLKIQETREEGQKEYARKNSNAFANFERISENLDIKREEVLLVYLLKHIDGICSFVKGHKSQRENVRGRLTDAIVYLCLLWGMIDDDDEVEYDVIGDMPSEEEEESEDELQRIEWERIKRR